MSDLCSNNNIPDYHACCDPIPNKPIDELLRRQVELYLKYNPEYELDRFEFKYENGVHTATPIYKHRMVQRPEDLKDKSDEFRSQNIV